MGSMEAATLGHVPARSTSFRRRLRRATFFVIILLIWEAVSHYLLPAVSPHLVVLLPPPTAVLTTFFEMLVRGEVWTHVTASLARVSLGFGLAVMVAIPLGVAIGWWKDVDALVAPLVDFFRPIPPMAWIPIGVLWFGVGDKQNVFIIFIGSIFPILLNTATGIRTVRISLLWACYTLGATRTQVLAEIAIPSALPMIFTGLRIGLGAGWMSLVAAELVAATSGLGYLIEDSRNYLYSERVLVGMILIGCLGLAMDAVMRAGAVLLGITSHRN